MSMHRGDLVDHADYPEVWEVASEAMGILEQADQPYSVLAGNHDGYFPNDELQPVDYSPYLKHFTPSDQATMRCRCLATQIGDAP